MATKIKTSDSKGSVWLWVVVLALIVIGGILFWRSRSQENTPGAGPVPGEYGVSGGGSGGPNTGGAGAGLERTSNGAVVVRYYNSGFAPKEITITRGLAVHFVNNSNNALRIAAVDQTNQPYASFNQSKSIGAGQAFDFTFNESGAYTYYNADHRQESGIVYVK